jgi:hypothetical protein
LSSLKVLAIHLFMRNYKKKILNDRKLKHISEDVGQMLKQTTIFEEAKEACEKESSDSKVFYNPPPLPHKVLHILATMKVFQST